MNKGEREKLGETLRLAGTGDLRFSWLLKMVIEAGFAVAHGRDASGIFLVPPKALADGFRVTERTVRNWIREGMPVHQFSVGNRPALYDVWDVVRWHEKRFVGADDPDPLMRGGNSPALERYRLAKANEAERKNKQAEGQIIEVAGISLQLAEIGRAFRTRAEAIARTYGEKVGAEIRRMVDEAQDEWQKRGLKRGRRKK